MRSGRPLVWARAARVLSQKGCLALVATSQELERSAPSHPSPPISFIVQIKKRKFCERLVEIKNACFNTKAITVNADSMSVPWSHKCLFWYKCRYVGVSPVTGLNFGPEFFQISLIGMFACAFCVRFLFGQLQITFLLFVFQVNT